MFLHKRICCVFLSVACVFLRFCSISSPFLLPLEIVNHDLEWKLSNLSFGFFTTRSFLTILACDSAVGLGKIEHRQIIQRREKIYSSSCDNILKICVPSRSPSSSLFLLFSHNSHLKRCPCDCIMLNVYGVCAVQHSTTNARSNEPVASMSAAHLLLAQSYFVRV